MKVALLALFVLVLTGPAAAVEDPRNDWMKHFYQTQDLGPFDDFWKMVVSSRILEGKNAAPPIVGFVSQVLHQHPALLKGRLDRPSALPPPQRSTAFSILWLSDTGEAREVLRRAGQDGLANQPRPPIGTWKIAVPGDLDLCWGWYFATGDTAALEPIISALDYGQYAGALKRYSNSQKTDADRQAAMKDAIFGAALWSLGANGSEDPRIAKRIRILFFDPHTPKDRSIWLGAIFAKTSPHVSTHELEENKAGR